ncbi:LysR family transcriptional regulator, nitrogen assimilation regulatory protein [Variovorax sp. YR634]|nr:LysR family transcriptional regulator, nitrogen assimilation regulatory protein [Variovorax sp. YR634]SET70879.1 LysR family transcriptional regulator, nitrogen assimilation regulatory protein [Variovorax sp. OV084]
MVSPDTGCAGPVLGLAFAWGQGVNLRRLKYFVKIVDIGSLTQAAEVLFIAQPALSQQLATLEGEVRQQLLVRTKRGVTPTEAGKVLYRHAQIILRQCEQARVDMEAAGEGLSGQVSVGLAPGTAASALSLPLLRTVRARHPGILLYLNENYGTTLSELIMNGRMDLAVLYGDKAIHGLTFLPLLKEPLFLVGPASMPAPSQPVKLADLRDIELFLPRPYNVVRKLVDAAFVRAGMVPRVVAEIESAFTLTAAIADGLGATILPASMAREVVASCGAWQFPIVDPVIEAPLALCQSDHLPLSEPAQAVKDILLELVVDLARTVASTPEPELAALS